MATANNSELPPLARDCYQAFAEELPTLLRTCRDRWVIYHGKQRLACGDSPTELLEEYHQRGYAVADLTVLEVEPAPALAEVDW